MKSDIKFFTIELNHWYLCEYNRNRVEARCIRKQPGHYYSLFIFPSNVYFNEKIIDSLHYNFYLPSCIKQQFSCFPFALNEILEEIPAPYEI